MEDKRKMSKIRRQNARLYPIYKMFAWDLLFFYAIEFLFYTIAKKLSATEILVINGIYLFSRVIMQIPAVLISKKIGRKKSIVLGNLSMITYLILLMKLPGALGVITANLFFAFGYAIKTISETNLLYDSVSTRGGEGLYSKIDAKGGSFYYILDGITSLTSGFFFVINPYIPVCICLGFVVISTLLSLGFKDIYKAKPEKHSLKKNIKEIKSSFQFILTSRRMKSLVLYQLVFYGFMKLITIYNSDLLVKIGVPEQQFAMIFAMQMLIGGLSINLKDKIEKKFKNRVLSFIGLEYIFSCFIIGIISKGHISVLVIPSILILLAIMQCCVSIWYILEAKYLKNFSTHENRSKISFAYEVIRGIGAGFASILGGMLLKYMDITDGFIVVSLIALLLMILVLDYMKTRIGLKPEQYRKEDIEFKE